MQNLWLITNRNAGSTSHKKCEALEAVFAERGLALVGRTLFPDEDFPTKQVLAEGKVDTLVLFAGDGTINAAICRLADWEGAFLILPGGTMNMLAKRLHAASDPSEIVHSAHINSDRVALPYVEAGSHRAFVGLILGPAGHWFHTRELIRARRLSRLAVAVRFAWRRSFGKSVRVAGMPALRRGYQAIFIQPREDGLDAAAVSARDWSAIAELGWEWLTGDWVEAQAVTHAFPRKLQVEGAKPTLALFDGEPQMLAAGTVISGGMSRRQFISTRSASA